ncbi:GntR family transcriptional regulator [Kineococcus rhizosphaerae]|uniref:Regulatory GntR family protein n=1 Tax=Kineococcus rhizosphaerae TaxID=559628 RepID=A0A2T0QL05_9ACTN|nr:regulatory GntR family protein [Kineococcus rhizosphaerae]
MRTGTAAAPGGQRPAARSCPRPHWRRSGDPPQLPFERVSRLPLWHQLEVALRRAVRAGDYTPGEQIETLTSLAVRHGVSVPTARHALEALVRTGDLVPCDACTSYVVAGRGSAPTGAT